jgi:hypothetical protein
MESVPTTTRTPRLCPFSACRPDLKIVSGIGHRMKAMIESLTPITADKAFSTVNVVRTL